MILRGRQIQRRGHGKCGLLSDHAFSINLAELALPGGLATVSRVIAMSTLGGSERVRL